MSHTIFDRAKQLLEIHSPSGFCANVIQYIKEQCSTLPYEQTTNEKGNLMIHIPGSSEKHIGVCAHVDTLGLMLTSIRADGTLRFTNVGGPILPTLDGEYCEIITRDKQVISGTILCDASASHVHKEASTSARTIDTMYIRLDAKVHTKEDVVALGIQNGDYICIDTKTQIKNDFIKSRFLDDKLSAAILLETIFDIHKNNITPAHNTTFIFSTYEEVGHGCANIPSNISELLAVDMGCIGEHLSCSEYDVSICAKDSSGPYDYAMTSRLIETAKRHELSYAIDVYPYYGSDASAALRAGNNIKAALIGPGVHASHGMERSHIDGVMHTFHLLMAYLKEH